MIKLNSLMKHFNKREQNSPLYLIITNKLVMACKNIPPECRCKIQNHKSKPRYLINLIIFFDSCHITNLET